MYTAENSIGIKWYGKGVPDVVYEVIPRKGGGIALKWKGQKYYDLDSTERILKELNEGIDSTWKVCIINPLQFNYEIY